MADTQRPGYYFDAAHGVVEVVALSGTAVKVPFAHWKEGAAQILIHELASLEGGSIYYELKAAAATMMHEEAMGAIKRESTPPNGHSENGSRRHPRLHIPGFDE